MGISVTEYLGNRTDSSTTILPQSATNNTCPFNGNKCEKIIKGTKPVCSIRNYGRKISLTSAELQEHPFWIVCEHRLCSTTVQKTGTSFSLTSFQQERLLQIAQKVFSSSATKDEIYVRSEVSIKVNEDKKQDMHADYVMIYDPHATPPDDNGKRRVIIEMQGGGETSNTGKMTEAVDKWEKHATPTNSLLKSTISGVGILATNAWRRQQEQALVKSNVSSKTRNVDGFVLCVGTTLFKYLNTKLKLEKINCGADEDWQVSIISFKEDWTSPIVSGPIPLVIDQVVRISTYSDFVSAITAQGKASSEAFTGEFTNLSNVPKSY